MALTIKNGGTITKPNNPAYDVSKNTWEADHTITGTLDDANIASASTWNEKIGGSGTTNTVPKFTAAGTIGNSSLTDDGTNVTATATNIVSNITTTKDLGSASLKWREIHNTKLFNVSGTGTHTIGQPGGVLFGQTSSIRGSLLNNAKGGFVGGTTNDAGFGTAKILSTANAGGYFLGNFTFGAASNLGVSPNAYAAVGTGGSAYGGFALGYAWTSSAESDY